jgi:hypothetical protein
MSARSQFRRLLLPVVVLCVTSVLGLPARADVPPRPDPDPVENAAPPFSADQLRAAITVGETWIFQVVEGASAPVMRSMRVTSADEFGLEIEVTTTDQAGVAVGTPLSSQQTWEELVAHATYPAATTLINESSFPLGDVAHTAVHYHAVEADSSIIDADFVTDIPGPPGHMTIVVGTQQILEMTLVEHIQGQ